MLAASDRYWTDPEFSAGLVPNTLSTDSGAKLHIAEWALTATVKRMEEAGHEVLLVADVPRWDGSDEWSPDDCTVLSLLAPMDTCQRRMPIARVEERQGSTRKVMRAVEASLGVAVLDPWTVMCPDGYCSNHSGQVTTYRDTNHITVGQSRALADVFRVAISAVAVS